LETLTLQPGAVPLAQLAEIYWKLAGITLDRACRGAVEVAADRIAEAATDEAPVYGVNTGFGKLASIKMAPKDTAILQRNLILSHCCEVGEAISTRIVRLMMALKPLSLGRGASGVGWGRIKLLEAMLVGVLARLRADVATIGDDRYLTPDLEAANQLIASAQILNTLNIPLPELAA